MNDFVQEYNALTCFDSYYGCPGFLAYCGGSFEDGSQVSQVCARTCDICTSKKRLK